MIAFLRGSPPPLASTGPIHPGLPVAVVVVVAVGVVGVGAVVVVGSSSG